jgi:hypothetical protein
MFKSRNDVTGLCHGGSNLQYGHSYDDQTAPHQFGSDSFDGIVDTIEMNLIFELDKKRTRDNQQLTSLLSVGLG